VKKKEKKVAWLLVALFGIGSVHAQSLVDKVNVMIGTAGANSTEYGGLTPSVAPPFAMTQWCAQTRESSISSTSYHYKDNLISGFTATHQPAIWMGDYGMVTICPQVGILFADRRRSMNFSHSEEQATPYSYAVDLHLKNSVQIHAEMAATSRAGILSFKFPATDSAYIFVEASREENFVGWIHYDSIHNELIGYNPDRQSAALGPPLPHFRGYFVVRFQKRPVSFGTTYHDELFHGQSDQYGDRCGAFLRFTTHSNEEIITKTGTSFISIEQARFNLDHEIPDWDIKKTGQQTKDAWDNYMSRVSVTGGTNDQQVSFYTALYRTMQYPREFSEYGKYYSAFDDKIHQGDSYNDYSLWDTYRAEHPLLNLVIPERTGNMIQSLVQMYKEGGWLPKWPNPTYTNIMIGTHADAVIADAIAKGIHGFDLNAAWQAVRKDAFEAPAGDTVNRWADRAPWTSYEARAGLTWYNQMGYIPLERTKESVSQTMEYSYDDWCVAQIAKKTGHLAAYETLMKRSLNYRNVFEKQSGFMLPRYQNGTFLTTDNSARGGFTEGSKWTYLFASVHDIPGFITLIGGPQAFEKKLDKNFDSLHYAHDNEPGHHYIYLYDYIDKHQKTEQRIYENVSENYKNTVDGLSGNDDCGQMSAWLIFTSMGFYPVCPGSTQYAIGVPLFDNIRLKIQANGKPPHELIISRKNYSAENRWTKQVLIDGKLHQGWFFEHDELLNAHTIEFTMGGHNDEK